jgi:DNA-binding NarL/FixJ family response regulator
MPQTNGLTAARILKRTMPNVHLILFTLHGTLLTADETVAAEIDAEFSKDEPITALLEKPQRLLTPEAA